MKLLGAVLLLPIFLPMFMLASLVVGVYVWIHFLISVIQTFKRGWSD